MKLEENKLTLESEDLGGDIEIIDTQITVQALAWIILRRLFTLPHIAIANGNLEGGFNSIVILIKQLESVCLAQGIVNDGYDKNLSLKKLKENDLTGEVINSNIKLQALLKPLFKQNVKKKNVVV